MHSAVVTLAPENETSDFFFFFFDFSSFLSFFCGSSGRELPTSRHNQQPSHSLSKDQNEIIEYIDPFLLYLYE